MLLELTIKDFAIIDSLHLRLHRLFNVFTGETGAGKSIIIDAVNALLGGKIGAEYVRAGCERATVEGVFSIEALPAISDEWLSLETDEDGDALHSIGANGASTVFEALDQAETRSMQRLQVDAASADARVALAALLHEYDITPDNGILILSRDIFRSSGRTVARIKGRALSQQALQQTERDQSRRAEFLRFEIDEIEKAELRPGEIEELEGERKVLSNAEQLREHCELVYGAIKGLDVGGDDFKPALDQLQVAQRSLGELTRLDKSLQEYADNLAEAIYRLEDVAASISSYESDIEDNPRRLSDIEERLDQIARLKRKYGATIEEILQRAARDQAELDTITNREELIAQFQRQDGK